MYRPFSDNNIRILLMFLVGFRVQKNVTQGFKFSNVSTQIGVLIRDNLSLEKIQRKKLKKFARVTDEHCGKK